MQGESNSNHVAQLNLQASDCPGSRMMTFSYKSPVDRIIWLWIFFTMFMSMHCS